MIEKNVCKIILTVVFVCTQWIIVYAGTTLNPSLYAFGARQIGMGRATLADKADPNNIFSNPASLDFSKNWQISGTSSNLLGDVHQTTAAGSFKTDFGTIGIGFVGLSTANSFPTVREPSVTGRIILDPSSEAIGYDNSVLMLSYSKRVEFHGDLSLGVGLKTYNQSISGPYSSSRGTAMDLDLGALYCPEDLPWLSAGFSYQNLLSSPLSWNGASSANDSLGGAINIGGQVHLAGKNSLLEDRLGEHDIVGALDMELPRNVLSSSNGMFFRAGLEWKPVQTIALRLGYDQSSDSGFNYGIGLEQSQFRFDYAYKADPVSANNSHIFSLSYAPDPEKPKNAKKKGDYVLKILSPADKTSVTDEAIKIYAVVENAHKISRVKINGKDVMPLVTGNSFEAFWPSLEDGANVIKVEARIASPETGSVVSTLNILRAHAIKDVKGDYFAKDPITYLNKLGLMKGYSDGSFKPEQNINRAELVTLLVKAKGYPIAPLSKKPFTDMPASNWAAGFASVAAKEGLVKGYPDGSFKPSKNVSRAEAAVIISRFSSASLEEVTFSPYTDVAADNWAIKDIVYAKKKGMLSYIIGLGLEPNKNITRGEVAYMLSKTPLIQASIEAVFSLPVSKEAVTAEAKYVDFVPLPDREIRTSYNAVIASGKITSAEVKDIAINGKRLKLEKGAASFAETIPLATGINTIEVKALGNGMKDLFRMERKVIKN
ncbi:MAG: S-layer homology domain-containing protein [Candidatus Margulisiibacteriota bacterium]